MTHYLHFLLLLSITFSQTIQIENTRFTKKMLTAGKGESSIAFADVNRDQHMDVVIVNQDDESVLIFLGDGNSKLTRSNHYEAGKTPTYVSTADINTDGFVDLVIANHETSYLTLFNGDGNGQFKVAANSPFSIDVDPHPHVVLVKDINKDNQPDIIVDHRNQNGLRVHTGFGKSNFTKKGLSINVGGDPYRGYDVVDLNNDGWLDIVTPNSTEVAVLLNSKSEQIQFKRKTTIPSPSPFYVKAADLNHDGFNDLIVASMGNTVSVLFGDGKGNFNDSEKMVVNLTSGAKQIAIGDINGDGHQDALISCWNADLLVLLGHKSSIKQHRFQLKEIPNPWGIGLADLNEDGKDDFLISDGSTEKFIVLLSEK